jgi:glucose-1-phosphate adenylyltransferase
MDERQNPVLAIILGGGRGTRLFPLTQYRCKPAVPLAGTYRLVDIPISNCLNAGYNRIFVLTQFLTASLHRHIHASFQFDPFSGGFVEILAAEQTDHNTDWYQGTADAVRRNLQHFAPHEHDLVLILSGDQLYRMDFRSVVAQHVATSADVTVSATPVAVSRVAGLGLLRVAADRSISAFVEKPTDPTVIKDLIMPPVLEATLAQPSAEPRCLASMGIYVFSRAVLQAALDTPMSDFGREIIPNLLGRVRLFAYVFDGYWADLGTVRTFFDANLALTQPQPPLNLFDPQTPIYTHARYLPPSHLTHCTLEQVVCGEGCIVTDARLRHCVVGSRSRIEANVVLEDVVMLGASGYQTAAEIAADRAQGRPPIGIGRQSRIRRAIIDRDARIGEGVVLAPAGHPDGDYPHGLMIREGILCVSRGACIPAGFML